jgi:hypothetical protein
LLNQQNLNHDGIYSCTGIYFFKSASSFHGILSIVPFILESDALVSRDTFFASSGAMVNDLLCRKHSAMTDCPCVTVYKEFRDEKLPVSDTLFIANCFHRSNRRILYYNLTFFQIT